MGGNHEGGKPVQEGVRAVTTGPVTLLFSSKEVRLNNAAALKEFLETEAGGQP